MGRDTVGPGSDHLARLLRQGHDDSVECLVKRGPKTQTVSVLASFLEVFFPDVWAAVAERAADFLQVLVVSVFLPDVLVRGRFHPVCVVLRGRFHPACVV